MSKRTAKIQRDTKETQISCEVNIDGIGESEIETGIGFLDHMLDSFSFTHFIFSILSYSFFFTQMQNKCSVTPLFSMGI